ARPSVSPRPLAASVSPVSRGPTPIPPSVRAPAMQAATASASTAPSPRVSAVPPPSHGLPPPGLPMPPARADATPPPPPPMPSSPPGAPPPSSQRPPPPLQAIALRADAGMRDVRTAGAHVVRSRAYSFALDARGMPIEVGAGRFARAYLGEER